jgi:5-dehydro-2-deoxygluconokinase
MYRDNVVDLKIDPKDIEEEYIKKAKVLLVSGTALSKSPSREAVFLAVNYAEKNNTKIIFDIDYRPYSWKSKEETAIYYKLLAEKSEVIIGSREEFNIIESLNNSNNTNDEETSKRFLNNNNTKLVVIKHGKDGSTAYIDNKSYDIKVFPVKLMKSFGGGDAYASAFIYGLLENWEVIDALEFGSASAAMVVSAHSCSEAMPTSEDITKFIKEKKEEYGEMVVRN